MKMQKRVLIYDDDVEILMVCKVILENQDYVVETLMSCEKVITDIEAFKPHLILMDLWIPKSGGENAINLIRENPLTNKIPVILFSANDEIEKISQRVNASGFLKKPFDISQFIETIERHIL
jgi:two-component system cell cycle response regulator DivK